MLHPQPLPLPVPASAQQEALANFDGKDSNELRLQNVLLPEGAIFQLPSCSSEVTYGHSTAYFRAT
ncbi:unnamed protein product [Protopolystoma xenopodis]|uniref:Uncharacterized protein n=1 Tax=Protopolystoma xenopodis TaxID=117903 RepID=A0A3S5BAH7_9PLAT|nr:unnamed protein product [Protopolystoma xenopodis]